jgi:N-acetylneuraminic acid mutarotase
VNWERSVPTFECNGCYEQAGGAGYVNPRRWLAADWASKRQISAPDLSGRADIDTHRGNFQTQNRPWLLPSEDPKMSQSLNQLSNRRSFFSPLLIALFGVPGLSAAANQWTWIGGANTSNAVGVYGTSGVAATTNIPGARMGASSWRDKFGNLWIFGGRIPTVGGVNSLMNDLWKFDPLSKSWTWVSGALPAASHLGVFGTKGTPAAGNVPGGREGAASWTDSSGNLWLFGGLGFTSNNSGLLNDLWKFDPVDGMWTWVSGSNAVATMGSYGMRGVAAAGSVPGSRMDSASWADAKGVFWIFGGEGCDATHCGINGGSNSSETLNDLWRFDPASGQWTWVSGSTAIDVLGNYGVKGSAAASNVPPARRGAATWSDCAGMLWMYGGSDLYRSGTGALTGDGTQNDLWQFNPSTEQWTWTGGSTNKTLPAKPAYGTQGMPSVSNSPGSREFSSSWTDQNGGLWLFGGSDFSISGADGYLNDLWKFDPTDQTWVWVAGQNTVNSAGDFGTQGVAAAQNSPGARGSASAHVDLGGNFWLFSGGRLVTTNPGALFNDLWEFTPDVQTPATGSCARLTKAINDLPIYFKILFGVTNDGGGVGYLPGKGLVHIPPRDPEGPILRSLQQALPTLTQQAEVYSQTQGKSEQSNARAVAERRTALRQSITVLKQMEESLGKALATEQARTVDTPSTQ